MGRPVYALLEESGPDHRRSFRIEVRAGRPDRRTRPGPGLHQKAGPTGGRPPGRCAPRPASPAQGRRRSVAEAVTHPEAAARLPGPMQPAPPFIPPARREPAPAGLLPAVQSLLYVLIVALFLITFTVQPIRIPSGSMEPTLAHRRLPPPQQGSRLPPRRLAPAPRTRRARRHHRLPRSRRRSFRAPGQTRRRPARRPPAPARRHRLPQRPPTGRALRRPPRQHPQRFPR